MSVKIRQQVSPLLLLVVLAAILTAALIHTSAGASSTNGSGTVGIAAAATPSASPTSTPPAASSSPVDQLPADVQAQLKALSPGTVIVPCNSSEARLPEGIDTTVSLGFIARHPGWRFLLHGYCADNPSATPLPPPPNVDPSVTAQP